MTEDERKCPRCAEIIKKDAVICRFCGLGKPEPADPPVNIIAGPKHNSFQSCMGCLGVVVLGIFVVISLPSFSASTPEPDAATPSAAASHPVLIEAGLDIVPTIAAIGAPWNGAPISDNSDGAYPITRRNVFYDRGSVTVDRAEDGGIYVVRAVSGIAEKCGPPAPVAYALAALVRDMRLPTPNEAEVSLLLKAWQSKDGDTEVQIRGARIHAVGGCLPAVTVTAIPST